MKPLIAGIVAFAVTVPAYAGHCHRERVFVKRHVKQFVQHGYAQQHYAPQIYYMVGQGLRDEALLEKLAEKTAAKVSANYEAKMQSLLSGKICVEFGAEGGATVGGDADADDAPAPAGGLGEAQAIFNRRCVSCHGSSNPKAGLDLSDVSKLSCAKFARAVHAAFKGTMPPQGDAIPEAEAEVLFELLGELE